MEESGHLWIPHRTYVEAFSHSHLALDQFPKNQQFGSLHTFEEMSH
jgi:hypothetical protein